MTHETIQKMLVAAYKRVSSKKDSINSINMFPVPDQDTGDNLTATLQGVYNSISSQSFVSMQELRDAAIDGAICNASGNVGIITTGFLNGFLSNLTEKEIPISVFSHAFSCGYTSAYDSIQNPKEGTILDVIKAAADSFSQTNDDDLKKILKNVINSAKIALDNTQNQMELYKKTSTVDAGGYGFLLMLEGFLDSLSEKSSHTEITQKKIQKPTSFFQFITHRYEVISLLSSLTFDKKTIVSQLNSFGDCLDIIEANQKMKIHIHTDLPDDVVELISTFGSVTYIHTTDMTKQIEDGHNGKKSVGLVVDSASGLDIDFAAKHDIVIVPFKTSWEKVDQEKSSQNLSIYEKMRLYGNKREQYGWPKTSQPAMKIYLNAFKEQLQKYDHVICITTSVAISGSYNCAVQAQTLLPGSNKEKVIIPDFRQIAPGQAMLTTEITNLIDQGYTFKQIKKRLPSLNSKIDVFGSPEDMTWIINGGRVVGTKAKIVSFLQKINFKPIFCESYKKITLRKIHFTHKSISSLLLNYLNKDFKSDNGPLKIVLQHGDSGPEVQKFKNMLDPERFQIVQETFLAPVIGIHTGPGTIIIGILKS